MTVSATAIASTISVKCFGVVVAFSQGSSDFPRFVVEKSGSSCKASDTRELALGRTRAAIEPASAPRTTPGQIVVSPNNIRWIWVRIN